MLQTNHKGKDKEGGVYYTKIMNGTDTHIHQTEGPPGSGSSFKWLWSMGLCEAHFFRLPGRRILRTLRLRAGGSVPVWASTDVAVGSSTSMPALMITRHGDLASAQGVTDEG